MPVKLFASLLFLVFSSSVIAQPLSKADKQLIAAFDTLLAAKFKKEEPGATVLVSRKGQVIYQKGFGMADMELKVPMRPEMVFRIGSISKQFTAVAILQLMEKGKLSLQDDIKKFIPDYPTHGYTITVEHLLTHTSGIKSYTSLSSFDSIMNMHMKPLEMIAYFKNQPMDFAPGTQWNYNNSGYFILGYIIEKVSGLTYEEYVKENLFKPAGMTNSAYGNDTRIIANRAKGYQQGKDGYENARPLSMTLPYAAGSLVSTVEDLWKWNQAVHAYKLVSKESLQKAFTDYKLTNGKPTKYGYGWGFNEVQGAATIEHSGGINGFVTDGLYIPSQDIFIAIFANCDCRSLDMEAPQLAALTMGKPYIQKEIAIDETTAKEYVAVYENETGEQRFITAEGNQVISQRGGGNQFKLKAYEKDGFFFENSLSTIRFIRNPGGQVDKLEFKSRNEKSEWIKTNKPLPVKPGIVKTDAALLATYIGEYELAPNFIMTVTVEGDKMMVQATGQSAIQVYAESATKFFPKEIDAKIEFFKDAAGKVTHLVLYQGGRETKGTKIK
jgi:CubicO group peptidase (beta-lactamase class C family)